jgi:lipooligosaccharide transport system permease protein
MKSVQQLEVINVFLLPMFLFSGSFYQLSVFPEWLQTVIRLFPLAHAIDLVRGLTLGNISWGLMQHVMYFVVMIIVGLFFTTRRFNALFMR